MKQNGNALRQKKKQDLLKLPRKRQNDVERKKKSRKIAQLQAKEAELRRREEEIKRKEAEQQKIEEEEKRKSRRRQKAD